MKIQTYLIVILLSMVVACGTSKEEEPVTTEAIEEKTGTQEMRTKHFSEGEIRNYVLIDYDENGRKIKGQKFNADSVALWYWIYEYEDDKITKSVVYHGEDEVSMWADISNTPTGIYYAYEYEDTLITKITEMTAAGTVMRYSTIEYDKGVLAKETWHTADGTIIFYMIMENNEEGVATKGNVYNYKDVLVYYELYEYEDDMLTKIVRRSEDGEAKGYDVIRAL